MPGRGARHAWPPTSELGTNLLPMLLNRRGARMPLFLQSIVVVQIHHDGTASGTGGGCPAESPVTSNRVPSNDDAAAGLAPANWHVRKGGVRRISPVEDDVRKVTGSKVAPRKFWPSHAGIPPILVIEGYLVVELWEERVGMIPVPRQVVQVQVTGPPLSSRPRRRKRRRALGCHRGRLRCHPYGPSRAHGHCAVVEVNRGVEERAGDRVIWAFLFLIVLTPFTRVIAKLVGRTKPFAMMSTRTWTPADKLSLMETGDPSPRSPVPVG